MNDAPVSDAALRGLEEEVRRQLSYLMLPAKPWVAERHTPQGERLYDTVIVGAGMFGIAAAIALILKGVSNILLVDAAPAGREGPWRTFARMKTLRSPKDLPGPSLNIPSLTFRAWYEAAHGLAAWQALYKIPNGVWQDYLDWLTRLFALPVQNETCVVGLDPGNGMVRLTLADGRVLPARRVVLATGRLGAGGPAIPAFVDRGLWPDLAAHASEDIDFSALRGRQVAVIGAGASAWDNAATALEAGAAGVSMYARRRFLPQVNKGRASAGPAYFEGWAGLEPAQKWGLLAYLDDVQSPPPHETVNRVLAHGDRFQLSLGTRVEAVRRAGGKVVLELGDGPKQADFLILGTGFLVDVATAPMLSDISGDIALWRDRYTPPPGLERPHLGKYPWLGSGFELQCREQKTNADLERIHLFSSAGFASFGFLTADIPGLSSAAERLSTHIVRHIFAEDFSQVKDRLVAWEAEYELEDTPYFRPPTA